MNARYKTIQISLHWLTLLFTIALFITIFISSNFSYATKNALKNAHFNLGIIVWLLIVFRFYLRFKFKAPAITPPLSKMARIASHAMHDSLYLLFLLQPIIGVFTRAFDGRSWTFLGIEVPSFVTSDETFSYTLMDIHETLGMVILIFIALHAFAAIFHHYIIKDDTLIRMLPKHKK